MPKRRAEFLACVLLALMTLLAYFPTFQNGFVDFDDDIYVANNAFVRQGLSWDGLRYAWTTGALGNWIPLTWMSYEATTTLLGFRPWAFHAIDLALHVLNVCLLFLWLNRAAGRFELAWVAAALFAVHPLHVESVAWIAERKDVLSTLFLLLALSAYTRYLATPSRRGYAVILFWFLCSLLSKPMAITFPALLLLADVWPLQRTSRALAIPPASWKLLLWEKVPFLLVALALGLVALNAQGASHAVATAMAVPPVVRLANACEACVWYLQKTLLPTRLCAFYPLHPDAARGWRAAWCALGLASISLWAAGTGRRGPHRLFGWAWFLTALLPVLGLVQIGGQAHADRYVYVPHIGLLTLLVWEADRLLAGRRLARRLGAAFAALFIVLYGALAALQITYWHDRETLWTHALDVDERNWQAHLNLAISRFQLEDFDQADRHAQRAIDLLPSYPEGWRMRGVIAGRRQDWSRAAACFQQALREDPDNVPARFGLASAQALQGDLPTATGTLQTLVERQPENLSARRQLARLLFQRGDSAGALQELERVLQRRPDDVESYASAAAILQSLGRKSEAQSLLQRGLRNSPGQVQLHLLLGQLYQGDGRVDDALREYEQALQLAPQHVQIRALRDSLRSRAAPLPTP